MERYIRQILVKDFGGLAQNRLANAHIALIGLGGIGAPASLYLAGAGIGQMTIFEDDVVDLSNLHRQVLYTHADIGHKKFEVGAKRLQALNPDIMIRHQGRFDQNSGGDFDLILDGSDLLSTRHLAGRFALKTNTPLLSVSIAQWEGQIAHLHDSPCYACLNPEDTDTNALPSCAQAGVIGPVAGVIGTMAALEAVKIITQIQPLAQGQMLLYDGLGQDVRRLKISARANCPICETHRA